MTARRLATATLLVAIAGGLWLGWAHLPDRWDPWAPLHLAEAPNLLTPYKLRRLGGDPALCRAVLERSAFAFEPVADRSTGPGCGFSNAVRISASAIGWDGGFLASCPLAVALALFERHAVQPSAEALLGTRVAAVNHFGSYACRNVNNRESGRRSRHATADAIDIAGFRLDDGSAVSVLADWGGAGAASRFLRRVHEEACGIFGVVLGPDYNAAHQDHLHLDVGGFSTCR